MTSYNIFQHDPALWLTAENQSSCSGSQQGTRYDAAVAYSAGSCWKTLYNARFHAITSVGNRLHRCYPHWATSFRAVSPIGEPASELLASTGNQLQHCRPQWGTVFRAVSQMREPASALLPSTGNQLQHCQPQWGTSFRAVSQGRTSFGTVSLNGEPASALSTTMGNQLQSC
jgi:hypothetical protein